MFVSKSVTAFTVANQLSVRSLSQKNNVHLPVHALELAFESLSYETFFKSRKHVKFPSFFQTLFKGTRVTFDFVFKKERMKDYFIFKFSSMYEQATPLRSVRLSNNSFVNLRLRHK